MCVGAIAWQAHPRWLLVVAANRDEFHDRPAAPLARWESGIIAGRDLRAGGTWMGVAEAGRLALVTNFRVPEGPQPGRPSRGDMVAALLEGRNAEPLEQLNPFSLFLIDGTSARFISNHPHAQNRPLAPGIHGLSNGTFDAPWPKTRQLCGDLALWLESGSDHPAPLFAALARETPLEVSETGPEPRLAPVFIRDAVYGTRCSSLVLVGADGAGQMIERSFDANGRISGETRIAFCWPG